MTSKPKWVEALEAAEQLVKKAEAATTVEDRASLNNLAHTWLDIAREYRAES